MRKIILGLLGILMTTYGLRAQGIIKAEYFFDKDPGLGKGTSLAISSGDSVNVTASLPLGALSSGYHNVFIRVQDSSKQWSLYMGRNFYIQPAVLIPAPPMITDAEYFFDKDPGEGKGTAMSAFAATDSVSQSSIISIASLSPGFHNMFIRTKNSANQWSLYEGRNFYVQPAVSIPAPPMITNAEYFFDKDPGEGKGTAMSAFAATDSVSQSSVISIASLSPGFHNMFIRTKNSLNQWSLYEGRNFYVQPIISIPAPPMITAAEYFFDKDPGQGQGIAMPAFAATDSISLSNTVSLIGLPQGFHNIFIRTKNASNQWSLYEGRNFYITPPYVSQPSSRIVAAEYFFDKDPGQGKGVSMAGISPADSINITQNLNSSALSVGSHNAFIRVKDSTGHWSLYEGRTFKVLHCNDSVAAAATKDSCFGGSDGTATAFAKGGNPPYQYSWSTSPVQTTITATGLTAGIYTITVTDSIGCPATATVVVGQPQQIKIKSSITNATCGQDNGMASVTVTGGTGGSYSYLWNTVPAQTTSSVSALAPGTYAVIVSDKYSCSSTATIKINAVPTPTISVVSITPSDCGQHIGAVSVSTTGGSPPYKYSWNNGYTTATGDSLVSGNYIITVTDTSGCSTYVSAAVTNANGPVIAITTVNEVKCYGQASGAISAAVTSGGVSPFKYLWSTGAVTSGISNLYAGPYYVTVTDNTGCSGIKSYNLGQPSKPVSLVVTTSSSACSSPTGTAKVVASGGTPPYTFNWNSGETTDTANGLFAGAYTVTVTDSNGCISASQAAVSSLNGPVVKVDSTIASTCTKGIGTGSVLISVTGGTGGYNYIWSNSSASTTQNLSNVKTGTYNVQVTDAVGCVGTATATVPEVAPPAISICMVTVDPKSNHNYIVWDKSKSTGIESYNIYKETTVPGLFNKIGSVPSDSLCTYVDLPSNPDVQSWRYEISQVDSCGFESPLSAPHKTMHLTISPGTSNNVNLIWDNYEGLPFNYYIVYRDSVVGQAQDSIGYVPNSGNFTYTAPSPPSTSHNWYFHMGISNTGGCTPSIEGINYNASKSNTGSVVFVGINEQSNDLNSLVVYPNPSTGILNLSLNIINKQNITVKVYNAIGQALSITNCGKISGHFTKELDLSGLSKGVYILQVAGDNGVTYKKVVIQ